MFHFYLFFLYEIIPHFMNKLGSDFRWSMFPVTPVLFSKIVVNFGGDTRSTTIPSP